ncbi:MAG: hypothetical protein U0T82_11405 [Bacteroidales bacterium]
MLSKNLLFAILIAFCSKMYAQSDSSRINYLGSFFIVPVEFPVIEKSTLNNSLSGFGYPECINPIASIGVGFQFFIDRWIMGFNYVNSSKESETQTSYLKVKYSSITLDMGYDLIKSHDFAFYPALGLKIGGLDYLYQHYLTHTTSFTNYFNSSLDYKEIYHSRANLDLGLGLSYYNLLLINFRAGYLMPLNNGSFSLRNKYYNHLSGSPPVNYRFYFSVAFGYGKVTTDKWEIKRRMQL